MKKALAATFACALLGVWGSAIAAGDAAAGKTKSAACAGCHGPDGNSTVATYPKLAGQHAAYMEQVLKDYKSGARANATMKAMVPALSDQDIADLAAFYASQPPK